MRGLLLLSAALLAACSTDMASAPAARVAEDYALLPDFRPETVAACNAVRLDVGLGPNGALTVNGAASDSQGLEAAAARKNAACPNAPAMVILRIAPGVGAGEADALRERLARQIVNLTLVE